MTDLNGNQGGENTPPAATPPAATPPAATPPAATPPESFINPDGTLKPGWQNSNLIPEDFKGRKVYQALGEKPTYSDLLKHIGHQDIAISKQGKGVFVPGPDASQAEKDFFFKSIGRPDTIDGYKWQPPQELAEHYGDTEFLAEAKSEMHKLGITPQQFAGIMALDAKRISLGLESMKADPLSHYQELLPLVEPLYKEAAESELKTKWGDQYEARKHLANRAINEFTKEGEERDIVLARVGNDPIIADLLATIMQKRFTEAGGVDTTGGNPNVALNMSQRIEAINQQLTQQLKLTNRTKYDSLLKERSDLYARAYPEKSANPS